MHADRSLASQLLLERPARRLDAPVTATSSREGRKPEELFVDHPLLAGLEPADVAVLARRARLGRHERGAVLGGGARCLFLVLDGRVRVFRRLATGRELTLMLAGGGDVFGALTPGAGEADEHGEVLERATLAAIDVRAVQAAAPAGVLLTGNLLDLVVARLRGIEVRLEQAAYRAVPERLAGVIEELADRYGRVTPDGIRIDVRLTHAQLAALVGTSRETLTKALRDLRVAGVVEVQDRLLWVRRPELLARPGSREG